MRFRTVVIAAVVLSLCSVAAFAAFQISEDARAETNQTTITHDDSLAVEPGIRQTLQPADGDDPTSYGANGTETVEYNGTVWEPGPNNYTYYPDDGALEFNRNESESANITFEYEVPEDQARDEQLQSATRGFGNAMQLGVGVTFVVLLLFIGGFAARKLGVGQRSTRGR